jgi:tetratricopeptide (TPR) repeat protein
MAATRKLVQTTSIPELPPPPDFKFSSIIDGMNDILGAVGGSVEIKRKKANGVVEEMTDQEGAVKVADYRLKANATQHSMQHLNYTQKKAWVEARKSEGNSFFKAGKYDGAIQKYMEAVMGISSGDTAEEKEDSILSLQIPLLTNIAISMIAKEEWGRARSLLDEAIQHLNDVSPSSIKDRGFTMLAIKAYSRRGMCFVQIGLLKDASHDFRSALHLCQEQYPENKTLLHSIKRKLNDTKHRIEKDKKFVHQMMNGMTYKGDSLNHNSKAVLHLYEDRYDDAQKRTAPRNTRDGQFIDKVQVHNKSLSQSAELGEDNVYDSEDGESIGDLSLLYGINEKDRNDCCAVFKRFFCIRFQKEKSF